MYKNVWSPTINEELECRREPSNATDRYAVSVMNGGTIVGHLPKNISRVCSLFLRRGGSLTCRVTGRRRYSSDLHQGGLEIPCLLIFRGEEKDIKNIKKLIPN